MEDVGVLRALSAFQALESAVSDAIDENGWDAD